MHILFLVISLCQVLFFTSNSSVAMESACQRWIDEQARVRAMTPRTRVAYEKERAALIAKFQEDAERERIETMRNQVAAYDARQKKAKKMDSSGSGSDSDYRLSSEEVSPISTARSPSQSPPPPLTLPRVVTDRAAQTSPTLLRRVTTGQRRSSSDNLDPGLLADDDADDLPLARQHTQTPK